MKKTIVALVCLLASLSAAAAHGIVVEAESFDQKGGWVVDQQFMDVMGSPYLLAHGMGSAVADASTTFMVPEKGHYTVYVRTYNWTSPWFSGKGPGSFNISVNGKRLAATLGNSGNRWQWQEAGTVRLGSGTNHVSLHDQTGFDGRCDAICFMPVGLYPDGTNSIDSLRQSIKNNKRQQATVHAADFVVVGGGMAGINAAVAAARLGLRVALVQDRPILGGNNSSEVRVHLGGEIEIGRYPRLGGLLKEFAPTKEGNAMPAGNYEDDRKLTIIQNEPNIQLFLNVHVNSVTMDGQRIVAVCGENTITGEFTEFRSPLFADCTGDGTIGYLAGADYRIGREGREEFGESLAPAVADSMTMGASVQWYSEKMNKAVPFPLFEYGVTFNATNAEPVYKGEWTWETGLDQDQINNFEAVRDYGLLVVYSNWSFMKNKSDEVKLYKNRKLAWVAYVAGKRETRRLMGDYVLSQDDLTKNVFHEDASFTTTWSIDLHYPDSVNVERFPGRAFKADTHHTLIYPYDVPYRCLYSRNVDNLFMAGRNISVTHVALGTVRVMRTTSMMGEVVGMAAAVCHRNEAQPRDVYHDYLPELKQMMSRGIGGQHLPNNQKYNEGGRLNTPPVIR